MVSYQLPMTNYQPPIMQERLQKIMAAAGVDR